MRVGGIVLCGGKSSRMGIPKLALPFGSETLLGRVVRLLGEVVQPIVVVAAPGQELPALDGDVIVARDQREDCGPLEGLHAGLTAFENRADAAYATSCDVPLLVPEFVQRMIQLLGENQVAVPVESRFQHPLAAVYRTDVVPAIESLLDAGRRRPVFLYDEVSTRRIPVAELAEADPDRNTLANLNTPQEYLDALAKAGFEAPADIVSRLGHAGPT